MVSIRRYFHIAIITILLSSCNRGAYVFTGHNSMSLNEKSQADSLIQYALNHEALYTLCDTLKPMSSIQLFRLPLLSSDAMIRQNAIDSLQKLYSLVNKMNTKELCFILNPFERNDGDYKNLELYVVRKSEVRKMILRNASFYARMGIAEHASMGSVLSITEFENKYDRWRSYGYLFGYPSHAVDFFVEAGRSQDSTGQFVQRNFFAIPVFAGKTGYFTYAIPKNYQPTQIDSMLYHKAMYTLDRYRTIKEKNNKASAIRLLKKMNHKRRRDE